MYYMYYMLYVLYVLYIMRRYEKLSNIMYNIITQTFI